MKAFLLSSAIIVTGLGVWAPTAMAECVTKAAVATSGTADQAKWYALETTVQAVSWGLWPGYLQTSKVEGYAVHDRYKCSKDGGSVTCHVVATFCKR